MASLIDELLEDKRPYPLRVQPAIATRMQAPVAVTAEGERIRESLATGQYGSQPSAVATNTSFITNANVDETATGRYGNSFFNQPDIWTQNQNPHQLREQLRLDDLTTIAAQRKFELERAQSRAPVQDAFEIARLDHELASTAALGESKRFQTTQDAAVMQHVSGFADFMTKAPPVGTPEYEQYVLQGVMKFPRMATTNWGKDVLGKISKENDTISELISKMPPGFDLSTINLSKSGPSVSMAPTGTDKQLEAELKSGFKLTLGQVRNPVNAEVGRYGPGKKWIGDSKGDVVRVDDGEGKKVAMSVDEYKRFGGKFGGDSKKKHLGKYNPATGEIEP